MVETPTKLPVKTEAKAKEAATREVRHPYEGLRREMNRLFDDFDRGMWTMPFGLGMFDFEPMWRRAMSWAPTLAPAPLPTPAVDIVEREKEFEVTADLPGFDEKSIEVKTVNGNLVIKGEKREEKEETKKDYHLQERRIGSFERTFRMPETIDAEKLEASFKKGVLTVTLPKKAEALMPEKTIPVKAA